VSHTSSQLSRARSSPSTSRDVPPLTAEPITALSPSLGASVGYVTYRAFGQMHPIYIEALGGRHHPRELTIIARLLADGPYSQQELAESLSVNRSMMVHVIDELEHGGYVVRERNPSDRRSNAISATSTGAKALADAGPALLAADATTTRRLSDAEGDRLRTLLTRLLGEDLPAVLAPVSELAGYLIARAHFALHGRADEICEPLGLEVREYGTLATIDDLAPCSQRQIATMLGVSGPVIVDLIDTLEPRGLVVRERNPSDRRSYALRLTTAGAALLKRARAALTIVGDGIDERLGAADHDELRMLLRRLVGAEPAHP
jgi:DNA-binding MarR family transcriptional regulator